MAWFKKGKTEEAEPPKRSKAAEGMWLKCNHCREIVYRKEVDRNNAVYALQNNRNPYIDHPEWVHYVWGPTAGIATTEQAAPRVWYRSGVLYRADAAGTADIRLFDMTGRELLRARFQGSAFSLPELSDGVLIARVGESTVRFVR